MRETATDPRPERGLTQAADSIRIYNWNDYIAPQVLENFTRDTGIEVEYHTFASAEELAAALQSGQPIDTAVPSHSALLQQPGLYPDQDTKRRLYPLEVLSEKHAQVRNNVWQRFRDGS
ncbi:hypothetical protein C5L43_18750 [Ectopseudomonas oleovorans]|nr:hypothetical protein C5L43_18750 [Pseudomonas oleovorans]